MADYITKNKSLLFTSGANIDWHYGPWASLSAYETAVGQITKSIPEGVVVAIQNATTKSITKYIRENGSWKEDVPSSVNTAIEAKYTKPVAGIPSADLANAVQTSLGKADKALQSADKTELETKITTSKTELETKMSADKTELETKITTGKTELETKISANETSIAEKLSPSDIPSMTDSEIDTVWKNAGISAEIIDAEGLNITKETIGLGNVDNTSDANKPVSTAQQSAINNLQVALTAEIAQKYEKPSAGIPLTDMNADVQAKLGLATTSLQEGDVYSKEEVDQKIEDVTIDVDDLDLSSYAKKTDLSVYAKSEDLSVYAKSTDLSVYAKSTDLSVYAKSADIESKGYLTSIPSEYITESELEDKDYATNDDLSVVSASVSTALNAATTAKNQATLSASSASEAASSASEAATSASEANAHLTTIETAINAWDPTQSEDDQIKTLNALIADNKGRIDTNEKNIAKKADKETVYIPQTENATAPTIGTVTTEVGAGLKADGSKDTGGDHSIYTLFTIVVTKPFKFYFTDYQYLGRRIIECAYTHDDATSKRHKIDEIYDGETETITGNSLPAADGTEDKAPWYLEIGDTLYISFITNQITSVKPLYTAALPKQYLAEEIYLADKHIEEVINSVIEEKTFTDVTANLSNPIIGDVICEEHKGIESDGTPSEIQEEGESHYLYNLYTISVKKNCTVWFVKDEMTNRLVVESSAVQKGITLARTRAVQKTGEAGVYTDYTLPTEATPVSLSTGDTLYISVSRTFISQQGPSKMFFHTTYKIKSLKGADSENASLLKGKSVVWFGDSISQLCGLPSIVAQKTGADIVDCSFAGAPISKYGATEEYLGTSLESLSEQIVANNFGACSTSLSIQKTDANVSTENYNTKVGHLSNLKSIDWSNVDYVVIFEGTNDLGVYNMTVEHIQDSLRNAIENIYQMNPKIQIYFVSPPFRGDKTGSWLTEKKKSSDYEEWYEEYGKSYTGTDFDIVKDEIPGLGNVCREYNIPFFDFWHSCGVNSKNMSTLLDSQLLHPTDACAEDWATKLAGWVSAT